MKLRDKDIIKLLKRGRLCSLQERVIMDRCGIDIRPLYVAVGDMRKAFTPTDKPTLGKAQHFQNACSICGISLPKIDTHHFYKNTLRNLDTTHSRLLEAISEYPQAVKVKVRRDIHLLVNTNGNLT